MTVNIRFLYFSYSVALLSIIMIEIDAGNLLCPYYLIHTLIFPNFSIILVFCCWKFFCTVVSFGSVFWRYIIIICQFSMCEHGYARVLYQRCDGFSIGCVSFFVDSLFFHPIFSLFCIVLAISCPKYSMSPPNNLHICQNNKARTG